MNKETVAKNLRRIRKEAKISQRDLAYYLELDQSAISNIERQRRELSAVEAYQIAKILKIDVREFVK